MEALIKDSAPASKRREAAKTHTLQVSFPCPPSERGRENAAPANRTNKLKKTARSKRNKINQVLPEPGVPDVFPAMPVPDAGHMEVC